MVYKKSAAELVFNVFNVILMSIVALVTLYPFTYVLFASLSDPNRFIVHTGFLLFPKGIDLDSYRRVFMNPVILTGYRNTLIYVTAGTAVNMVMTTMGAYGLSRKKLYWKKPIMFMIVFTMFFNGGLIPTYLLVKGLGFIDTLWALILPGAVWTWNLIILRTALQDIPEALIESAKLDGANDFVILIKIVLPMSMPVLSVMLLFYSVGHWNTWFYPMIYLRSRDKYPLQLILREIIISKSMGGMGNMLNTAAQRDKEKLSYTVKYASIMAAILPVIFLYPLLQRYFVKGVMIGSLKE